MVNGRRTGAAQTVRKGDTNQLINLANISAVRCALSIKFAIPVARINGF